MSISRHWETYQSPSFQTLAANGRFIPLFFHTFSFKNLRNHASAKIGQLPLAAVVEIPQLVLIQPHRMQERGVEVAHVIAVAYASQSKFIRVANRLSALDSAA